VVEGEQAAGAGEAGLDLVGDQQHVVLGAGVPHVGPEAGGRHDHAGLALDGLHQDGSRVRADGVAHGLRVAVGDGDEARREGPVVVVGDGVVGEGDDGGRAAVEVVRGHDDLGRVERDALDLVGPLAGDLDGGLDGLGTGVHRQHHLGAGELGQLRAEGAELVVVEGARGQGEPVDLLVRGADQVGVAVPEVERGVPGEEVEVAPTVDVGDPRPLRLGDHHGERVVVVGTPLLVERDDAGGLLHVGHGSHRNGRRQVRGPSRLPSWGDDAQRDGGTRAGPAARPACPRGRGGGGPSRPSCSWPAARRW
jgi:hypothetical protein